MDLHASKLLQSTTASIQHKAICQPQYYASVHTCQRPAAAAAARTAQHPRPPARRCPLKSGGGRRSPPAFPPSLMHYPGTMIHDSGPSDGATCHPCPAAAKAPPASISPFGQPAAIHSGAACPPRAHHRAHDCSMRRGAPSHALGGSARPCSAVQGPLLVGNLKLAPPPARLPARPRAMLHAFVHIACPPRARSCGMRGDERTTAAGQASVRPGRRALPVVGGVPFQASAPALLGTPHPLPASGP